MSKNVVWPGAWTMHLACLTQEVLCSLLDLPASQHAQNNWRATFLPARRYASAGLCDSDVSGRPSVCLSVRHTPVLCLAERKQDREMYTV